MALITRISRLFTADVHAVLDRIEEPELVLKQAVREMTDEVARAEQQLHWLASQAQQLQQHSDDFTEQLANLNSELDLCFEAQEDELARSLVKRKLTTTQQLKQTRQALDSTDRDHAALSSQLTERRQTLTETRQKAELLVDGSIDPASPGLDSGISQDAIEVAFLKEKQRRQS